MRETFISNLLRNSFLKSRRIVYSLSERSGLLLYMEVFVPADVVWSGKSEPVLFRHLLSRDPNLVLLRLEIVFIYLQRRLVAVSVSSSALLACAPGS